MNLGAPPSGPSTWSCVVSFRDKDGELQEVIVRVEGVQTAYFARERARVEVRRSHGVDVDPLDVRVSLASEANHERKTNGKSRSKRR